MTFANQLQEPGVAQQEVQAALIAEVSFSQSSEEQEQVERAKSTSASTPIGEAFWNCRRKASGGGISEEEGKEEVKQAEEQRKNKI